MIAIGEAYSIARQSGTRFRFLRGDRGLRNYESALMRQYADNGFRDRELTVITKDGQRKTTILGEIERIRKWKE